MTEGLHSPSPYPRLEISQKAISENLRLLRSLAPGRKVLVPVKANAYGFDLETMMPFFLQKHREGLLDMLGVANPQEGRVARDLGWPGGILLLGGFFREHVAMIAQADLIPSITDLWQIAALSQYAESNGTKFSVHLKIDTGMGRIGVLPEQIDELIKLLRAHDTISVSGIFTHFPRADEPEILETSRQTKQLLEISTHVLNSLELRREDVLLHAANSYGVLLHPDSHLDMIRPGILFYGFFQSEEDRMRFSSQHPFRPGIRLMARPVSLRLLPKGHPVSYGSHFVSPRDQYPVGVFPIGYGDGFPRGISGKGVTFSGYPLLGRVTMDQIILGEVENAAEINFFSEDESSIEKLGDLSCSFSYEIITGLGNRLPRLLVES